MYSFQQQQPSGNCMPQYTTPQVTYQQHQIYYQPQQQPIYQQQQPIYQQQQQFIYPTQQQIYQPYLPAVSQFNHQPQLYFNPQANPVTYNTEANEANNPDLVAEDLNSSTSSPASNREPAPTSLISHESVEHDENSIIDVHGDAEQLITFHLKQTYPSFDDFENNLNLYGKQSYHLFKTTHSEPHPTMKYKFKDFRCIHQGKAETVAKTRVTATFAKGCNARIRVKLNKAGFFEITKLDLEHINHTDTAETYKFNYRNRRLNEEEKLTVFHHLKTQGKPALIAELMTEQTNKQIIPKDIYNIREAFELKKFKFGKEFTKEKREMHRLKQIIDQQIKSDDGFDNFSYAHSAQKEIYIIYYQNENMRKMYDQYGTTLYIDSTYKLNKNDYTCTVWVVKDCHGHSQIVSFALMAVEREITLDAVCEFFKKNNDVSKTRAIMIDKDLKEDRVLSETFSKARIVYCQWHVQEIFKKKIKNKPALEILLKMLNAPRIDEYLKLQQEFNNDFSQYPNLSKYFQNNWANCPEKWARSHLYGVPLYNDRTNNKVESVNGKIKHFVKKNSSFYKCLKGIFRYIAFVDRTQRYNHAFKLTKTVIDRTDPKFDTTTRHIASVLAKTSATFVISEYMAALDASSIIIYEQGSVGHDNIQDSFIDEPIEDDQIEFNDNDTNMISISPDACSYKSAVVVSKSDPADAATVTDFALSTPTCTCAASLSMLLPCRHIFECRLKNAIEPFSVTMIPLEWQLDKVDYSSQIDLVPSRQLLLPDLQGVSAVTKLSFEAKYNNIFRVMQELAKIVAHLPDDQYNDKLNLFKLQKKLLLSSKNFVPTVIDDENLPITVLDEAVETNIEMNAEQISSIAVELQPDEPIQSATDPLVDGNSYNSVPCVLPKTPLRAGCSDFNRINPANTISKSLTPNICDYKLVMGKHVGNIRASKRLLNVKKQPVSKKPLVDKTFSKNVKVFRELLSKILINSSAQQIEEICTLKYKIEEEDIAPTVKAKKTVAKLFKSLDSAKFVFTSYMTNDAIAQFDSLISFCNSS